MDADKEPQGEEKEQAGYRHLIEQASRPSGRFESQPRSSIDNQDSAAGTDADAELLSSDMDSAGDGYRRRRAQLMNGLEDGSARRKKPSKKPVRGHRNTPKTPDEESKHLVHSSDEGQGSDFSSRTTSEELELDHLTPEDPFSDDEETGMTKKDKRHRKRRRKKAMRMDERVAGNVNASKPNKKFTYSEIYKAWLINALLVASWYTFSLSISIVSEDSESPYTIFPDSVVVQQMDVLGKVPGFPFPSLHYLPAYAGTVLLSQPRPLLHSTIATSVR